MRDSVVITISEYTRRLIESHGSATAARIVKIRPGADPTRFSPSVPARPLAQRLDIVGHRVILTVGRLMRSQRYKGQDMVIRALPAVVRVVPDVLYVVAGTGDDAGYLRSVAAEIGVANHLKIIGKVADEDLPALYACCDVFVLCGREVVSRKRVLSEGFGIVLIEASATGKPVVGGVGGGIPEAVRDGETGFLVDPVDPEAIAATLIRILTNTQLATALGANGRDWVVRELNWDRARREFDEAIARLVPRGARPPSCTP